MCADALSRLIGERKHQLCQFLFHQGPRPKGDFLRKPASVSRLDSESESDSTDESDSEGDFHPPTRKIQVMTRAQAALILTRRKTMRPWEKNPMNE
jgi:hypothetical protein